MTYFQHIISNLRTSKDHILLAFIHFFHAFRKKEGGHELIYKIKKEKGEYYEEIR
jgi:hypothetical protein